MEGMLWFGNVLHAQWVPCPAPGMSRTLEGYVPEFGTDAGGLWIDDDASAHAVYTMEFPVQDAHEYEGIEAFTRFKHGSWGKVSRDGRDAFLRFVDPMQADANVLNAVWAEPGLAEDSDFPSIADVTPTFADVGANSYYQPRRAAVFTLTGTASGTVPSGANSVFTLLIPPTHKVWFGATGALTGAAKLRIQPVNLDGTLAATVDVTPTSDATAPGYSNSFSGATYRAIKVYLTTNAATAAVATLSSMRAVYDLIANTPAAPGRHIPGSGHAGLKFRGSSRVDTYIRADDDAKLVGASLVLAEVEPSWPI